MKGLSPIPGEPELAAAYARLGAKPRGFTEPELALWSQWARFDPRLAELLVEALASGWRAIPPIALNDELRSQPWPGALGVLLEQVRIFGGLDPAVRALFIRWSGCVMEGIDAGGEGSPSQYFIGLRALGGKGMLEDARLASKAYRRWGFLGREELKNKSAASPRRTVIPRAARLSMLRELAEQVGNRITVNRYLESLGHQISRRQAERDLRSCPGLQASGRTRACAYLVTGRRRRAKAGRR